VIERLNLELEVARTNARTNGTSYANVVKGSFTTPPPPLPPVLPQPLPQTVPEDDLERRQAVNSLFTLYESQHLQMMKIRDLLRK
jgi:outer membrane protein TolC